MQVLCILMLGVGLLESGVNVYSACSTVQHPLPMYTWPRWLFIPSQQHIVSHIQRISQHMIHSVLCPASVRGSLGVVVRWFGMLDCAVQLHDARQSGRLICTRALLPLVCCFVHLMELCGGMRQGCISLSYAHVVHRFRVMHQRGLWIHTIMKEHAAWLCYSVVLFLTACSFELALEVLMQLCSVWASDL